MIEPFTISEIKPGHPFKTPLIVTAKICNTGDFYWFYIEELDIAVCKQSEEEARFAIEDIFDDIWHNILNESDDELSPREKRYQTLVNSLLEKPMPTRP